MRIGILWAAVALLALKTPAGAQTPERTVALETLALPAMTAGYGTPRAGRSVDGNPLKLNGVTYAHGVGTHAPSELRLALHGGVKSFTATVGVDDEKTGQGSVRFSVTVDGKQVAQTPVLHGGDPSVPVSVDLTGAQTLILRVSDAGDGMSSDHADWADAVLTMAPNAKILPNAVVLASDSPRLVVLPDNPRPALHGPRITGATPGHPFLFRIPATGQGPLTFSAKPLPPGLTLDPRTGIISGTLLKSGSTRVHLAVRGPQGRDTRDLTIVGGAHRLALTPPMGWNSWNVWAGRVDDGKVRAAADQLISTGLAGHGYQYVNMDDTWEAGRDAQGRIQTNPRFPDMTALSGYVHGQGLKLGIYSSPGPKTCGGYAGSYQHEDLDAATYAAWGIDYLKYDWCSYGQIAAGDNSLPALQKPYAVMQTSLAKVPRDIVYSLCQYGMGNVWTWGPSVDANCWRTHGDIFDNWQSLHGIYEQEAGHETYAGPGHWNDPDMLMVGVVGFGNTHPTHLTPNEQILHISLWCLLSSPLLIGCDLTRLDPFTRALLSNDEAIDINQDPLGHAASRVAKDGEREVWARPLFDGTHAVGLVNGSDDAQAVTVHWADLHIAGRQPVRDLWLHKSVGRYDGAYSVRVPAHGCVLIKVGSRRAL